MAYAKDDIERVRQATNLVELIEATTTVKKSGRSFKAICPFHQEKTPSLSIDPAKGVYYCFGCGVGGDVFTFVEETQGLDFNEAVEELAAAAGVTLRRDPGADRRRGERTDSVEAVEAAIAFYVERLKSGDDAGPARAYLRSRGYDAEIVEQFQIGYSPTAWDDLVQHLRAKEVKDRVMLRAGLARRDRQGRLIDYFRGRILFPIFDLRGDPVGFGGRKLEGEGPKYLNSPETSIYQKARLLYGLNWAKSEISRRDYALVVEGYTDVIALHMAGLPLAVATCGTALGDDHFDLLRRFCDRVILAFDADAAGAGAAVRADDLHLPADLSLDLRVAIMPDGRDPADVVQDGDLDLLQKALDDSEPVVQFRIDQELAGFELDEPEGRARAVRAVIPHVARLSDGIARREYAGFIARRTGVDRDAILAEVERAAVRRARPSTEQEDESRLTGPLRGERELLRLLLSGDAQVGALEISADLFKDTLHREAFEVIENEARSTGEPLDLGSLLGDRQDDAARLLRRLAVDSSPLADGPELLDRLERARVADEISDLRRQLENLDPASDDYSAAFQQLIDLEQRKRDE
ncbi:MAG: DNA primase [Acidimicrobiia bacterium]